MKLAEALSERADAQKRMEQLRTRLALNARVQEGEAPAEEPEALLRELDGLCARLEELVWRINRTNAESGDGQTTLTALLARRDALTMKVNILRDFLDRASETALRGGKNEIIIKSTVAVPALRRTVDGLSQELRQLEVKIQALNWSVELI